MADPASISSPGPTSEAPREFTRAHWATHPAFICLLLAVAIMATYYPVIHNQFVTYDDPDYVTDNAHVKNGLNPGDVAWAFRTGHAGNWHPLTWLSHMMDVQLFKLNPAGHHLTNVLFHTANTILLFAVLRRLTATWWRSAFVAALFALHPLHVESVAWISERKDVLSAFFFVLTLLAYASYAQGSNTGGRRSFYLLSLTFFALGLMSKPMLVTVPCVLILVDYWPLGRFQSGSIPKLLIEKIPFFALSAASCVATLVVQKEAQQTLDTLSVGARVGNSLVSYARYLLKMFWPFNLATPYPHPGHWPVGEVILAALLLGILTLTVLWFGRRSPFAIVGWLWFLGMLVPVIGIIQVGEQSMADRYTYLPYIGIFIVLVWTAAEVCGRLHVPPVFSGTVGILLLALCAVRARDQVHCWEDSYRLYRHAIAVSKNNFIAYYNLGSYLDTQGRMDEAMTNYLKAVEIQPHYQDPLNNLGVIFANRKQFADAIPYFEAAIRLKGDFTDANANLANSLRESGKFAEAIPHYRAVLEKRPEDTSALNGLGNALSSQGQFAEAIPYYEKSLHAKPDQTAAHYDLGNAFLKLRRLDEAIGQYRLAVEQKPDHAHALHDLGVALAMKGRTDEAIAQLRQAVRVEPENPIFALSLGKVLGSQGSFDQALPFFTQAVRLAPNNPDAHNGLGSTLAAVGRIGEAIEQFEISLQLRPANPATHFNLGKALAAQGKIDAAREHYNEALRLRPDFAPARRELDSLAPPNSK